MNSITRQDVLDFLKAWERPDGAFLGIVGMKLDLVTIVNL